MQKLFSNHWLAWGINYQYSIEYVPIINVAFAATLSWFSRQRQVLLALLVLICTYSATARSFNTRIARWLDKAAYQFYKKKHYRHYFNIIEAHRALKLIPDGVPVSASTAFVPHLAFRDYIFEFPVVGNAQYVMYLNNYRNENITDPVEQAQLDLARKLHASPNWEEIYNENFILILKRKPGAPPEEPVILK